MSKSKDKNEAAGTITIDPKVFKKFRKFVAEKHEGQTYGFIKTETEQALMSWMTMRGSNESASMITEKEPTKKEEKDE